MIRVKVVEGFKSLLFVNKKKQKTFVNFIVTLSVPSLMSKSFLLLFFKKEDFLLFFAESLR